MKWMWLMNWSSSVMWCDDAKPWGSSLSASCFVFTADIWRSFWEEPLPLPAHHPGHPGEVPGWGESSPPNPPPPPSADKTRQQQIRFEISLLLRSQRHKPTVNVLILRQSRCPGLWEVLLWTGAPGLHLQAFGGSGSTDGNRSQLPVWVFVISLRSDGSQIPFCSCGRELESVFEFGEHRVQVGP